MKEPIEALRALQKLLTLHGERNAAAWVNQVIASAHESDLQNSLSSRELWGGAGSIADQAGMGAGQAAKAEIEIALVELAKAMQRSGMEVDRAKFWAEAFEKWREMRGKRLS